MTLLVYMTAPTWDEANRIATALVEEKLAAGVNIVPSVHSVYRWKGDVCKASEVILFAQATEALFETLRQRVCELHSYETPCIIAMPLTHGDKAFLQWIVNESKHKEH